jgi:hypothetical protein
MEDGYNEQQPQCTRQKTSYRNGIPQEAARTMVIKFLKCTCPEIIRYQFFNKYKNSN